MDAGFGIQLLRGNGATPEVFTAVAQVTDVAPPKLSRATIDVSNHASPSKYAEFMGGLRNAGEVGLTIQYEVVDGSDHNSLRDDLNSNAARNFRVKFPDVARTIWNIAGLVKSFEPSTPRDGVITAQISIQVSSAPAFVLFEAFFNTNTNPGFQAASIGAWTFLNEPLKSVGGDAMLAGAGGVNYGIAGYELSAPGDLHGATVIGVTPTVLDQIVIQFCLKLDGSEYYSLVVGATTLAIKKVASTLDTATVTFAPNDILTYDYDYETGLITVYKNGVAIPGLTATDTAYRDNVLGSVIFGGTSGSLRTSFKVTRS